MRFLSGLYLVAIMGLGGCNGNQHEMDVLYESRAIRPVLGSEFGELVTAKGFIELYPKGETSKGDRDRLVLAIREAQGVVLPREVMMECVAFSPWAQEQLQEVLTAGTHRPMRKFIGYEIVSMGGIPRGAAAVIPDQIPCGPGFQIEHQLIVVRVEEEKYCQD